MSIERIEILKTEIAKRQSELNDLTSKLMKEETDIRKKFVMWANNGLPKKQRSHLPDGAIRKWIDDHNYLDGSRGAIKLLDIDDAFGLFCLSDKQLIEWKCMEDAEALKEDAVFIAACEQMMEDNMDSFEIDW
jgi:hypothetical protein